MEYLFTHVPTWVWLIVVFFLGYGVCRIVNLDDIEEGRKAKKLEDDRLAAYIKQVQEEHAQNAREYEAKKAAWERATMP